MTLEELEELKKVLLDLETDYSICTEEYYFVNGALGVVCDRIAVEKEKIKNED